MTISLFFFYKNHTLNAIKLQIEIGNVGILALVDTGAEVSVMSDIVFASLNPLLVKQLSLETNNLTTASNDSLKVKGCFQMPVQIF